MFRSSRRFIQPGMSITHRLLFSDLFNKSTTGQFPPSPPPRILRGPIGERKSSTTVLVAHFRKYFVFEERLLGHYCKLVSLTTNVVLRWWSGPCALSRRFTKRLLARIRTYINASTTTTPLYPSMT